MNEKIARQQSRAILADTVNPEAARGNAHLELVPLDHEGNATGEWMDDDYTISSQPMSRGQKLWYDLTHPVSQILNPIGDWFNGRGQPSDHGRASGWGNGRSDAEIATAASVLRLASELPPVAVTLGGDAYLGYGASGSLGLSFDPKTGQFRAVTSGGAGPGYGGGIGINFGTGERDAGAKTNMNLTLADGLSGTLQAPADIRTGKIGEVSGMSAGRGLPGVKTGKIGFGPKFGGWANGSIDYTSPATPALWDLSDIEIRKK